jgi:anti-sigma B factor antagonist
MRSIYRYEGAMSVILQLCSKRAHIVRAEGALRTPVSRAIRHHVRTLLRRGERQILLDLSQVSGIDAAGVGELIRTFNMTAATNGALRIVNTSASVREMLERAHLFDVLSGEREVEQRFA